MKCTKGGRTRWTGGRSRDIKKGEGAPKAVQAKRKLPATKCGVNAGKKRNKKGPFL